MAEKKVKEPRFTKAQFLESKKYVEDKDLIAAIIKEGSYTETEVQKRLKTWKEKEVM